jgi:ATP/maltotriose-dependent transcriptional regulator MalT
MTPPVSATDPLAAGRAALARAEWAEAWARFEEAAAADDSPEAWEGVSRAAWWVGDQEATLLARERAYRGYRQAGDVRGAARMAMWLGSDHLDFRGDDAVASAWLRRGRTLLEGHPPCAELGFITLFEADIALLSHSDPATAERDARDALEIAPATGEVDVETIALAILGSALIASGAVEEGLERLDESAALAVAEEFGDTASPGWALCHTVSGCAEAGDFGRAEQWCRALHSWSAAWRARHFFGICRTAYGGVLATRGDWPLAEEELCTAMEDIGTTRPALAAPTAVRLGELRVRQGRLDEARALFESALSIPRAVVGLGELDLQAGDPKAAAEAAERVLRRLDESSVLDRLPALELLARARATAGEAEAAYTALEQIQEEGLATPYMRGRVRLSRAEVLAAAGDCDGARQAAEDAIDLFAGCSAPYEAARARLLLASALEALGRAQRATAEARAAKEALELLGARQAERGDGTAGEELSPREVDILRLVAQGMSDARIADRLFLSPHTVHRHVANIRTKLRAPSRAAAVAYATKLGLL